MQPNPEIIKYNSENESEDDNGTLNSDSNNNINVERSSHLIPDFKFENMDSHVNVNELHVNCDENDSNQGKDNLELQKTINRLNKKIESNANEFSTLYSIKNRLIDENERLVWYNRSMMLGIMSSVLMFFGNKFYNRLQ